MPSVTDPLSGPIIRTEEPAPLQGQTVPHATGFISTMTVAFTESPGVTFIEKGMGAFAGGPQIGHDEAVAKLKAQNYDAGGIPEEIISKVFEPYFTTKGPDKGTGVGLFMAKNIIEKNMDGTLSVCNTTDGAEFRIEV